METNFTPTTKGTGSSQLQVFVSRVETTTRVVLAGELDGASAIPPGRTVVRRAIGPRGGSGGRYRTPDIHRFHRAVVTPLARGSGTGIRPSSHN
jgi:hypothetical protein